MLQTAASDNPKSRLCVSVSMSACVSACMSVCVSVCSYLNSEVVRKSRQCKVNVDFYKIGIEYEGARTEVGEVSSPASAASRSQSLVFFCSSFCCTLKDATEG